MTEIAQEQAAFMSSQFFHATRIFNTTILDKFILYNSIKVLLITYDYITIHLVI